jgi:hypothetical protein
MNDKHRYTFATLRYVHDVVTGEFINVGVLLRADSEGKVRGKFRTSMGRVTLQLAFVLRRSLF